MVKKSTQVSSIAIPTHSDISAIWLNHKPNDLHIFLGPWATTLRPAAFKSFYFEALHKPCLKPVIKCRWSTQFLQGRWITGHRSNALCLSYCRNLLWTLTLAKRPRMKLKITSKSFSRHLHFLNTYFNPLTEQIHRNSWRFLLKLLTGPPCFQGNSVRKGQNLQGFFVKMQRIPKDTEKVMT